MRAHPLSLSRATKTGGFMGQLVGVRKQERGFFSFLGVNAPRGWSSSNRCA